MTFDFTYPTPLPSTKGWGPGWPNCQTDRLVTVKPFVGGFRAEIAELMTRLVAEMRNQGFDFMEPGCWGFGCRATKAASGSGTATPSFHSWGLAPDINAPRNVFGAPESTSEIATTERWVVPLMRAYGFFWLGPVIGDWMHFSFVGSPADARAMTMKARDHALGEDEDMTTAKDIIEGSQAGREAPLDQPPPSDRSAIWRWAFNEAKRIKQAALTPKPGAVAPHEHNLEGKAK